MYGDFTRNTSKPEKHYSDVRMQQGRVLLDSDWNESVDIEAHRTETEAVDVIGKHGGPADGAGFRILTDKNDLPAEERESVEDLAAGDFYITSGRYYVDGILCENESTARFAAQIDLPGAQIQEDEASPANRWLIYLDVWKRHISHIEDPDIREVALGGPDTTTRSKIIWQVKAAKVPLVSIHRINNPLPFSSSCEQLLNILPDASRGMLTSGRTPVLTEDKPCQISPKGGYQGLENRLYRVEIHQGNEPLAWPRPENVESVDAQRVEGEEKKLRVDVETLEGIPWAEGQMIELYSDVTDGDGVAGNPARIDSIKVDDSGTILSFDQDVSSMVPGDSLKVRRVASFKWSRDNGSVTSAIDEFVKKNETDTSTNQIRISPPGRDKVLTFRPGDTVEILNDEDDLLERPGILAIVDPASTSDRDGTVVLSTSVPVIDKSLHPKLRRWDYNPDKKAVAVNMAIHPVTLDPVDLEEGIRIQFSGVGFRSRDYWCFAARTTSGEVEELKDAPPQGIKHHYAPLAVIKSDLIEGESFLSVVNDCRRIFPPLTEMTSIYYAGGNGQSGYPEKKLDSPLRVRVAAGGMPVANAPVLFRVLSGSGSIVQASLLTDEDGIAEALWTLGGFKSGEQQAEAVLEDGMGNETDKRVFFNADLSLAEEVFYDGCTGLDLSKKTVQEAIEKISRTVILNKLSGDNQVAVPNPAAATTKLIEPLVVIVASSCGPIAGALVRFEADDGTLEGSTTGVAEVKTDGDGRASVIWSLDNDTKRARRTVRVTIINPGSKDPVSPPLSEVIFTATLSRASTVSFDPKGCLQGFEEANTVQKALEQLCTMQSGQEPGLVVERISVGDRPLDNDDKVRPDELAEGIRVVCSSPRGRDDFLATISEASCFVTVDIPYPLNSADVQLWGRTQIGYQQIILKPRFIAVDGNIIFWRPLDQINEFLKLLLNRMRELGFGDMVLARFTLKGNFLWTDKEPRLYLDGDAFGTLGRNGNNSLVLPSGDGRKGGDFEIWFWVVLD